MTEKPSHTVLHFTLATAGHVDHGKTSLLRALTGIDPDRLKEEKEREMTTDIGFAHLRFNLEELKKENDEFVNLYRNFLSGDNFRHDSKSISDDSELVIGFVDVPGHGKFLKNMLAGVGGIDMALLVVALDEGVMPQTVQHVKILSLLGVRKCIVVLTKVDLAQEEEVKQAELEVKELLQHYNLEAVASQSVSNISGLGIGELKKLVIEKVLSASFSDNRFDLTGKPMPCFLPVDRIFNKPGYGVVVTGTLISGELRVGENIKIAPAQVEGRVRGLQTFNHKAETAFPGQRLAVNIATKEAKALERGQCVVSDSAEKVHTLVVQINDLGGLEARNDKKYRKLKPQPIRFYHGTAERSGSLRWLQVLQDGDKEILVGQIFLREPVLARPGQNYVIRYGDFGIAGGVIVLTDRPRWLNRDSLLEIVKNVLANDLGKGLIRYITECPGSALSRRELSTVVGARELNHEVEKLADNGLITELNQLIIANKSLEEISNRVVERLEQAPSKAVASETLRVEVAPLMERVVFQHLVNHLLEDGVATKDGDKLSLPDAKPSNTASPELLKKQSDVMNVLQDSFVLELSEVAQRCSLNEAELKEILQSLDQENRAALVNYEFAATASTIQSAHKVLADIWNQKRNISPSDFRQGVGTSRKYAMALLAHFDDKKITRRLPSGRVLLKAP